MGAKFRSSDRLHHDHAGSSSSPGLLADRGLLGSLYPQHGTRWQAQGGPQYLEKFRAGPRLNTQLVGIRGDSVGTVLFTELVSVL